MLPFTVNAVSPPKLVILFCAVCDKIPLKVPPSMVPGTVKLLIVPLNALNVAALTMPDAVRFAALILFDTFKLVSVPILVIFG
jgi:hypothetical protein